jgi:hypothetical protein
MQENEYADLVNTPEAQKLLGTEWGPLPTPVACPPFPVAALPTPAREMVEAAAEAFQVDPGMPGCFILAAPSIAALGHGYVCVKEGYNEPLQLYVVVSALPSERKSPVLSAILAPIRVFIKNHNEMHASEVAANQSKRAILRKKWEKAIGRGNEEEATQLAEELQAMPDLRPLELLLTDSTPEALAKAMGRNNGRMGFASGEGGLFNVLAGAYSDQVNLDVILQGYSGEAVAIERVSREPVRIEHAALAVTLAVQPQVLDKFLTNEVMLERGLAARFMYSQPPSKLGTRLIRDARPIPSVVSLAYERRMRQLTAFQASEKVHQLSFSTEAMETYYRWAEEVEGRLSNEWAGIANGWEGKLVGNTVRLAGAVKLLDDPDPMHVITGLHFSSAVELARYFIAQALHITGKDLGLAPDTREVLEEIKKQGKPTVKAYDLRQKLRFRKRFEREGSVNAALLELERFGYIRQGMPPEWNGVGRPPEALWEVHPDLLGKRMEVEEI